VTELPELPTIEELRARRRAALEREERRARRSRELLGAEPGAAEDEGREGQRLFELRCDEIDRE